MDYLHTVAQSLKDAYDPASLSMKVEELHYVLEHLLMHYMAVEPLHFREME